jgi:pimeloyl-ACP methyl ester carboxylesterase
MATALQLCDKYPARADLVFLPGHDGLDHMATNREVFLFALAKFIGDAHVIAYSMGARLVLWSLSLAPRIAEPSSLTLLSGHSGLQSTHDRPKRYSQDLSLALRLMEMNRDSYRSFLIEWNKNPIFGERVLTERDLDLRTRAHPLGVGSALAEYSTALQPNTLSAFRELDCPKHLFVGSKDEKYRIIANQIIKADPRAKVEVVQDSSHDVLASAPRVILSHLDGLLHEV